ncbi:NAD(P)H-dependent glycerol-3-phosphate dehydrogenase [Xinfangfangia sp. CPCC 101601]|uniref:Glycerol-3-phosphate dehydrogenase [NAD(P)+] n=1 Tax=Pseudogemmobacter lacusdianii TaxID=3069608 RepID=A0ABU0VVE1_9RHOB|nr:NAD(P)H-dependent glycerol-3-phosphate dehydrogenase [Xinfangfangia sp. CPCC 101601]MDQ2065215.1 NAD(P)H-dependent glycerol-3-phosphate dehydrogenase [Xinfangfangia sp. CPCC 101601]
MIGIAGAGAFGTALAIALASGGREVRLWGRDPDLAQRRDSARLPGMVLPEGVRVVENVSNLVESTVVLLTLPMQQLRPFLASEGQPLLNSDLVACCKGIDLTTLKGPAAVMREAGASGQLGMLTGPSFAFDIARGLPTALTLASTGNRAEAMQTVLSTQSLRLYRTDDVVGAELGGALKNVIAIAAGVVCGAGLGDSARAALITRGYAEMQRLALALGARAETLAGLSGLGDLILTCTSTQSRNFAHGMALGAGTPVAQATVEGVATARAAVRLAETLGIEMPVAAMVARLVADEIGVAEAVRQLMSRPLKQEQE